MLVSTLKPSEEPVTARYSWLVQVCAHGSLGPAARRMCLVDDENVGWCQLAARCTKGAVVEPIPSHPREAVGRVVAFPRRSTLPVFQHLPPDSNLLAMLAHHGFVYSLDETADLPYVLDHSELKTNRFPSCSHMAYYAQGIGGGQVIERAHYDEDED